MANLLFCHMLISRIKSVPSCFMMTSTPSISFKIITIKIVINCSFTVDLGYIRFDDAMSNDNDNDHYLLTV